ncbi:hypothetical protein [Cryobacterium sp. TMT1-66-1]|uniref:hypothetical protein n=1 Tax=Cryobacterium sp. TMT1-66-1 TaxID=1259242 RepID=UPI00141B54CC|nr:hypothetical protein [Cryobacterium sp. TMT1-66-1]
MVGVIVAGVIAGTIAATVFAVIPWSQDTAAKANLDSTRTAESVAFVQTGGYLTSQELVDQGYLEGTPTLSARGAGAGRFGAAVAPAPSESSDDAVKTTVNDERSCFVSAVQSDSGKTFWTESTNPTVAVILPWAAAPETSCVDADTNEKVFPEIANVGIERALFTAFDGTDTFMYSYSEDGVTTKEDPVGANFDGYSTSQMYNGNLYFTADGLDGIGKQIWEYNGTESKIAKQFSPTYDPNDVEMAEMTGDDSMLRDNSKLSLLTVFEGTLLFQASDVEHGDELWSFDGDVFELAADINPGSAGSNLSEAVEFDRALYLSASNSEGIKNLWKYDGSTAEAVDTPGADTQVDGFTIYNEKLYFHSGGLIHVYDGTSSSTLDLTTYRTDPLTVVGDMLYISNPDWTYSYSESAGLNLVSTRPFSGGVTIDGSFYGAANIGEFGNELIKYGPSYAESTLVADINSGAGDSNPDFSRSLFLGDQVLFPANDGAHGYELWTFDGTTAALTSDVNIGSGNSSPTPIGTFQ